MSTSRPYQPTPPAGAKTSFDNQALAKIMGALLNAVSTQQLGAFLAQLDKLSAWYEKGTGKIFDDTAGSDTAGRITLAQYKSAPTIKILREKLSMRLLNDSTAADNLKFLMLFIAQCQLTATTALPKQPIPAWSFTWEGITAEQLTAMQFMEQYPAAKTIAGAKIWMCLTGMNELFTILEALEPSDPLSEKFTALQREALEYFRTSETTAVTASTMQQKQKISLKAVVRKEESQPPFSSPFFARVDNGAGAIPPPTTPEKRHSSTAFFEASQKSKAPENTIAPTHEKKPQDIHNKLLLISGALDSAIKYLEVKRDNLGQRQKKNTPSDDAITKEEQTQILKTQFLDATAIALRRKKVELTRVCALPEAEQPQKIRELRGEIQTVIRDNLAEPLNQYADMRSVAEKLKEFFSDLWKKIYHGGEAKALGKGEFSTKTTVDIVEKTIMTPSMAGG